MDPLVAAVLPDDGGAEYVAAAYLFFLLMVLVYIAIIGIKFQRINRELGELIEDLKSGEEDAGGAAGGGSAASSPAPEREESGV